MAHGGSILAGALRSAFQRLPLEAAAQLATTTTVVVFVFGSAWRPGVAMQGAPLRWPVLFGLLVLSLLLVATRPPLVRVPAAPYVLAACALGVSLASAGWSVRPTLTAARAVSLGVVFSIGAALSWTAAGRPRLVRQILVGALLGMVIVAVAGLVLLAVAPASASHPGTSRLNGIGGDANTVSSLFAVGLPIALWSIGLCAGLRRAGGIAAALLLVGSIVASGSRGSILAASVGAVAYAVLAAATRRSALLWLLGIGGVAVVAAVALALAPGPERTAKQAPTAPKGQPSTGHHGRYKNAEFFRRLQDDVGFQSSVSGSLAPHRSFFGSSGRAQAWSGALGQAAKRPLAGYGFGTEDKVFDDRYSDFQGSLVENSYLGLLLQLGIVGTAAFGVFVARALWSLRVIRRLSGVERALAAASGSILVSGMVLALTQSYVYSVGNVATVTLWLGTFFLFAVVPGHDG
jgi:O-antigen ligase